MFRPERFQRWDSSPLASFRTEEGDYYEDHRCAGEWITIELMKTSVRLLTKGMRYDVPNQDLRIVMSRRPALPASRFVINNL